MTPSLSLGPVSQSPLMWTWILRAHQGTPHPRYFRTPGTLCSTPDTLLVALCNPRISVPTRVHPTVTSTYVCSLVQYSLRLTLTGDTAVCCAVRSSIAGSPLLPRPLCWIVMQFKRVTISYIAFCNSRQMPIKRATLCRSRSAKKISKCCQAFWALPRCAQFLCCIERLWKRFCCECTGACEWKHTIVWHAPFSDDL